MLRSVLSSLEITNESLRTCSFTFSSAQKMHRFHQKTQKNLKSMNGKLYYPRKTRKKGDISEEMARKIAESGLNYQHLQKAYQHKGPDGLRRLLTAPRPCKNGEHKPKP